jgi:hypothetical protein
MNDLPNIKSVGDPNYDNPRQIGGGIGKAAGTAFGGPLGGAIGEVAGSAIFYAFILF